MRSWLPKIFRGSVGKSLAAALVAGAAVTCVIGLTSVAGLAVFFTSWASSVALLLTSPSSKASAPHRVGLCHVVTALIGLAAHAALPGSALGIGTAVGIGVAVVLIGDLMHPPAMANVAFAFISNAPADKFAAAALMGGIILAAFASTTRQILYRSHQ